LQLTECTVYIALTGYIYYKIRGLDSLWN